MPFPKHRRGWEGRLRRGWVAPCRFHRVACGLDDKWPGYSGQSVAPPAAGAWPGALGWREGGRGWTGRRESKLGITCSSQTRFSLASFFFCFYLPRGLVLLEVTVGCLTSVTPLCCARAALLEAALPKHIAPSLWGGSVQVERSFPGPFSFFFPYPF